MRSTIVMLGAVAAALLSLLVAWFATLLVSLGLGTEDEPALPVAEQILNGVALYGVTAVVVSCAWYAVARAARMQPRVAALIGAGMSVLLGGVIGLAWIEPPLPFVLFATSAWAAAGLAVVWRATSRG